MKMGMVPAKWPLARVFIQARMISFMYSQGEDFYTRPVACLLLCIHRAKSEISYVFYVDDRCRIGLIHMSATNPIEEI